MPFMLLIPIYHRRHRSLSSNARDVDHGWLAEEPSQRNLMADSCVLKRKKGLVSVRGLDPGIDMSNSDHSIPTWKVVVKEIHTPAMEKTHRVVYGRPFVANGCQISLRVCKLIEKLILRTEQPEQADLVDDVQFIVATELCKLGLCPWTAQQLCAALVEVSERPALLVGLKLWETG
ncbi:unnamed protein product [Fusarium graminearum]|uniref:Uncharacterized protein n=1 Tax=Gibberella zeae TaxID=5518 RepID=A0A9N8RK74_GIBZA|nr:unnamed protein product [Fusarium graminearum]CAF3561239.1 unnamed protein product [Fusarium graminearum]CAG1998089.1 unnamed protein product [Fusarium graminearum]CAG2016907.1 unnamed protein product [Fusarium graminearum]